MPSARRGVVVEGGARSSMSSQLVTMPCSIGYRRQDATLRLRLVADVRVLLAHAHHAPGWRGADDRREDRGGASSLANPAYRAVVDDRSQTIFLRHD